MQACQVTSYPIPTDSKRSLQCNTTWVGHPTPHLTSGGSTQHNLIFKAATCLSQSLNTTLHHTPQAIGQICMQQQLQWAKRLEYTEQQQPDSSHPSHIIAAMIFICRQEQQSNPLGLTLASRYRVDFPTKVVTREPRHIDISSYNTMQQQLWVSTQTGGASRPTISWSFIQQQTVSKGQHLPLLPSIAQSLSDLGNSWCSTKNRKRHTPAIQGTIFQSSTQQQRAVQTP